MKHKVSELEGALLDAAVRPGSVYGILTVVAREGASADGRRMWRCACACGMERLVSTKALRSGAVSSCAVCAPSSSRSPLAVRLSKWRLTANGCHEWTGRKNESGYGRIIVNGKETRAHRAMYFMHHPQADRSLVVMHSCDNPSCINLAHLSLGTVRDNMLDMHRKGRFRGGAKPGNRNAVGNEGWKRGGIVKMLGRLDPKFGEEV